MIVYSAWTVIREAYSENGEDEKLLDDTIKRIKGKIKELETTNEFFDLRPLNGQYHLTIKAGHNHRDEKIIDFFKWIAHTSIGSFGLLYIWDMKTLKEIGITNSRFGEWRRDALTN